MQIQVNVNKINAITRDYLNESEYNVHKVNFEFAEEYTDLSKIALFTQNNKTYKMTISNNECDIPAEILAKKGTFKLGVYAYDVEDEELILRYSPSPIELFISSGSYIPDEETENSEPLTPTDKEQILSRLEEVEIDAQQVETNTQNITTLQEEKADKTELPTKTSDLTNDSGFIDNTVNNLTNYTLTTQTGSKIDLEINSSTYELTAKLYDKNDTLISTSTGIDLPIESMVVNASYSNGVLTLTLQNGNTVDVDISDIVDGLVSFTDYPTSDKAGVIKKAAVYDFLVGSTGVPYADIKTYSQYQARSDSAFISKGTLENVITGKGLVSDTDYASWNIAGVIKADGVYGLSTTSNGNLYSTAKTYADYTSGTNGMVISKGTLENVLTEKIGNIESILEELDVGGGI